MALIDRTLRISSLAFAISRAVGSTMIILFVLGMVLYIGYARGTATVRSLDLNPQEMDVVSFNQKFIEGLYTKVDTDNTDLIFNLVFSRLSDTVIVYPTENYYYFSLNMRGKTLWGNLRLDAVDRDRGIIHFGYFEYDENGRHQDREGHEKAYSARDGVLVKRVERFLYSVSYRGRTVMFRLNDIGVKPPERARLRENEVFVGPLFAESGLKFFLLFNRLEKHFMYVLNEDGFTPESFEQLTESVVIGRRTGFAFYEDRPNLRKILIAVHGKNTDRNNYYDGPFDQLPDNYVPQINLKKYIEAAYPYLKGRVDQYGSFLDQKDARALINPYTVYYDEQELEFVAYCESLKLPEHEFYSCITPDPHQEQEP